MREFKGDWRDLFFGFRIALDLRKIFLSFVGAIFSLAGLFVILVLGVGLTEGRDFYNVLVRDREVLDASREMVRWTHDNYVEPVAKVLHDPFSAKSFFFPTSVREAVEDEESIKFRAVDDEKSRQTRWAIFVLLGIVLWLILIWSKFGGAISRIAAVEVARDERISTHEALQFAKEKYTSFFWAPVSVLIAFLFFYIVNTLGGLVAWIPWVGPILVGLFSVFAFLGGFVMLLIAIGGLFGWPLMSPAVSAEGTDAFDAVSRAFSYIYSRPWQYAYYWLVSGIYGFVSVGFVWVFTLLMVRLTFGSAQLGAGRTLDHSIHALFNFHTASPYGSMNVPSIILTVFLATIIILIYGLGFSYAISYCYSARTLMYFILRKRVDNTEMTEVFVEEEDEDLFDEDLDFGETGEDEGSEEKGAEDKEKEEKPSGEAPEKEEEKPSGEAPEKEEEKPSGEAPDELKGEGDGKKPEEKKEK